MKNQSGNLFFFIFIGVALFAALGFTLARSTNSDSSQSMSARKLTLTATELVTYAQKMTRTVESIRRKGYSESELSFEDYASGYANANCTVDYCSVFKAGGGNLKKQSLPEGPDWVDGEWQFHDGHEIEGIGETCGDESCSELIAILRFNNLDLCTELNSRLGVDDISGAPPSLGNISGAKSDGEFSYINTVGATPASSTIAGKTAACVQESTGCSSAPGNSCYVFYQVLLGR